MGPATQDSAESSFSRQSKRSHGLLFQAASSSRSLCLSLAHVKKFGTSQLGRIRRRDNEAKLDWVKDDKQRHVFKLLEEREASLRKGEAGADVSGNWYWAFRDSVELRARVAKDLQAESDSAVLRALIARGQVPIIAITADQRNRDGYLNLTIRNLVGEPALDSYLRTESENGTLSSENALGDISRSTDKKVTIKVPVSQCHVGVRLRLTYMTRFGFQIGDHWLLSVPGDSSTSTHLMDKRLTGRATWALPGPL